MPRNELPPILEPRIRGPLTFGGAELTIQATRSVPTPEIGETPGNVASDRAFSPNAPGALPRTPVEIPIPPPPPIAPSVSLPRTPPSIVGGVAVIAGVAIIEILTEVANQQLDRQEEEEEAKRAAERRRLRRIQEERFPGGRREITIPEPDFGEDFGLPERPERIPAPAKIPPRPGRITQPDPDADPSFSPLPEPPIVIEPSPLPAPEIDAPAIPSPAPAEAPTPSTRPATQPRPTTRPATRPRTTPLPSPLPRSLPFPLPSTLPLPLPGVSPAPSPQPFANPAPQPAPQPAPRPSFFPDPSTDPLTRLGPKSVPSPKSQPFSDQPNERCKEKTKRRRKRGVCAEGFFRETKDGDTERTIWRTRNCATGERIDDRVTSAITNAKKGAEIVQGFLSNLRGG